MYNVYTIVGRYRYDVLDFLYLLTVRRVHKHLADAAQKKEQTRKPDLIIGSAGGIYMLILCTIHSQAISKQPEAGVLVRKLSQLTPLSQAG